METVTNGGIAMTLGEKIKEARKGAGLTQEQLAKKLTVSRQAITKWESDKGIPDVENLKLLSKVLGVSVDYLLDDGTKLDMSVFREEIKLDNYDYKVNAIGRWVKKARKKDMVVREKYPDAKIHKLSGEQLPTKAEKIIDNIIGFFTTASFGTPQLITAVKNLDKEFYLVNQDEKQFFVIVTDEFIESRQLVKKITEKKFQLGGFKFVDAGEIRN